MKNSGSSKLAGRYVKALFDVASAASALDAVEKDLKSLADAAANNGDVSEFLNNPLLTREQSAVAVEALLVKIGAHSITRQFVAMLARQKRLPALPIIAELFADVAAKTRGEISAEVVSAAKLGDKEINAVAQSLSKIYGKKIAMKTSINTDLIGGMVVKIGSTELDGSIAGKLARLKNALRAA